MEIWQAFVLGVLQGLTEWLPVSSSGHLAIAQNIFHLEQQLFFDVVLHVATLLVVVFVFWQEIVMMLRAVFTWDTLSKYFRWAWYIIAANVITGIIGITFRSAFLWLFGSLAAVGIALILNGIILQLSSLREGFKRIDLKDGLLLGLVQGIAIIPGISRSGITISLGMFRNIEREEVAKFSFLMSVPAIIGAGILESWHFTWASFELLPFLIGFIASGIVGYITLKWLLRIISRGGFHKFSYYCFGLGIIVLVLSFFL